MIDLPTDGNLDEAKLRELGRYRSEPATQAESLGSFVAALARRQSGDAIEAPTFPRRPEAPAEDQRDQHRLEQLLATLGAIPEEHRWARFDAPQLTKFVWDRNAIERTRKTESRDVSLFVGAPGAGKSTLATALYAARLSAARWPAGLWIKAERLMLETGREAALGNEPAILARARRTPVFMLDDLGSETGDDVARAQLMELISRRHLEHRPTIVTTGLPMEELQRRYGGGFVRRLSEKARALVVNVRPRPEAEAR